MGKYLDQAGLAQVWGKAKETFIQAEAGKGLSANDYTTDEKQKLAGLSKVIVDAALSGTSTNPVQNKAVNAALAGKMAVSLKGAANGVAELDGSGKVPAAQLPSYVDDVVDAYVVSEATALSAGWLSLTDGGAALTPESGKIYIVISAGSYNLREFRWSGTAYAEVGKNIALGETSSTAYRGDRGKIAYAHSQAAHAPANAEANVQSDWNETNTGSDSYIKNKPASLPANGGDADTVGGHTVGVDVPANAKFTDTTYSVATQSTNGLMSKEDKKKLDGMEAAEALTTEEIDAILAS